MGKFRVSFLSFSTTPLVFSVMLDVEQYHSSNRQPNFARWLYQELNKPDLRLRVRLKAQTLHILCESHSSPDQEKIVPSLVKVLSSEVAQQKLSSLAVGYSVYKLIIYGRTEGRSKLDWKEQLAFPYLEGQPRGTQSGLGDEEKSTNSHDNRLRVLSPEEQQQKVWSEITDSLNQTLDHLGVRVRLKVQQLNTNGREDCPKRLWVICAAEYSPDASLIAQPLAQKLRQWELEGFREAVIRAEVIGEKEPDWLLKVDLTPPGQLLKYWASWGDIPAIAHLLNQQLNPHQINLEAHLQGNHLHLFCHLLLPGNGTEARGNIHPTAQNKLVGVPEAQLVINTITPVLSALQPQGIDAVAVYGTTNRRGDFCTQLPPLWLEWLSINSPEKSSASTFALAQNGNQEALRFLLEKSLNPNINDHLATGGIRIKLCRQQNLLHIMSEGLVCPTKEQVIQPIESLMGELEIQDLAGVRIYGRRSGQTRPLWNYGIDFADYKPRTKTKSIAETSQETGEIIPRLNNSSPTPVGSTTVVTPQESPRQRKTRTSLVKVWWHQIFVPNLDQSSLLEGEANLPWQQDISQDFSVYRGTKAALAWGLLGLLLSLQLDWLVGKFFSPTPQIYQLSTQASQSQSNAAQVAILAAARSNHPSFNNRILNEKLALYQQYVAENGAPDVLVVGSSRAMRGVNPQILRQALEENFSESVDIYNFGINGATAQVVDLLLRQVLESEQLPKLVIWADGARAFNSNRPDPTYEAIVSSPGFEVLQQNRNPSSVASSQGSEVTLPEKLRANYEVVDNWLNNSLASISFAYSQRQQLKTWLQSQFTQTIDSVFTLPETSAKTEAASVIGEEVTMDLDGFLPIEIRFNPDTYYDNHPRVPGIYDGDYHNFRLDGKQNLAMVNLGEFLQEKQVSLVFVNTPLTDIYLDRTRSKYEQEFSQYMEELAETQKIVFVDLAEKWTDKYGFFSDPSHLNRYGAVQVSQYLAMEAKISWQELIE